MEIVIFAVITVILLTVLYKLLPFREAVGRKPLFSLLPKYKMTVHHSLTNEALEAELARFGFKKKKGRGDASCFSRGSVLGDFSINLAKVDVSLHEIAPGEHELTVQSGWMAAFDTGDHWQFITELAQKLEKA